MPSFTHSKINTNTLFKNHLSFIRHEPLLSCNRFVLYLVVKTANLFNIGQRFEAFHEFHQFHQFVCSYDLFAPKIHEPHFA